MRYIRKFLILPVFLMLSGAVSAQKAVFEVNVPDVVAAGKTFRVEYVSDTQPDNFVEPVFEKVDVLAGPSRSVSKSASIVNGKTEYSSRYTYTYVLRCGGEGEFLIPAAEMVAGNYTYRTRPVGIKAVNRTAMKEDPAETADNDNNDDFREWVLGDEPPVSRSAFAYSGFSGGMTLHTGYLSAGTTDFRDVGGTPFSQDMSGMPVGIGGAVRFHFGKYLRLGAEGYSTSLKYGPHNSCLNIGWGGILVDGLCRMGRWAPFAGVTLGGGSVCNLTLTAPVRDDFDVEDNISYRRYSFLTVTPFAGVEFAATSHMHLVFKADWMTNVSNPQPDFPSGPRFYFGFSFYRMNN
jgi:hypothetical protein